jgi:CBS domain-containing protein
MHSRVRDVMTGNVVSVPETAGYKDIVIMMQWRGVSAFPVVNAAGRVVGVVSEADLLLKEVGPESFAGPGGSLLASGRRGERAKAAAVTAAELMSKPAVTIAPDASVTEAARLMYTRRVKRLPVVDTGRLVGIVSRVDVLSVFTRPDDEIRGEVLDKVIGGECQLDPDAFDVSVTSGIVTISGLAESRIVASQLIDAVRYLEGVVDVRDRITCPPEEPPTLAGGT